jgi:AP endonuclease-1
MSRRSSRKADIEITDIESSENIVDAQKDRKAVKVRKTVITKVETPAKKPKIEIDSDDEPLVTPQKSSPILKINRVKAKAVIEAEQNPNPKKAPAKRKVKTEDDEEEEAEKKAPKKRKTKEEKEAEAMPLAVRTAIGVLKKAMHIGAHVSGAGGKRNSRAARPNEIYHRPHCTRCCIRILSNHADFGSHVSQANGSLCFRGWRLRICF